VIDVWDGSDTEEYIDEIDRQRDAAANSIRGQGVLLLCRMDVSLWYLTLEQTSC
jgi:hypothetical protein